MKRPLSERFWEKVKRPETGCWTWTASTNAKGYGHFADWQNGKSRHIKAHRLAWELTNGPIPQGLCVLHRCDNPPCCNPNHLFLGDRGINFRDCLAKGRRPLGNPKLKPEQVIAIRAANETQETLASKFGVNRSTVSYIKSGKTWKHLTAAPAAR